MSDQDRAYLATILEQTREKDAPTLHPDKYFEVFSAEQILKVRKFDLDMEQIRSGITGRGDDGGIDSFYLFVNRRLVREDTDIAHFKDQQLHIELVLIQSKHAASFAEDVFLKFSDFTDHCLKLTSDLTKVPTSLYSQSILDAVGRFHTILKAALSKRPSLAITFYYASLGEQIHPKVETRRQMLLDKVRLLFSTASCNCDLVGAPKLLEWYYQTPTKVLPLEASRSLPWSEFGTAYICLAPLRKFFDFITDSGELRGHIFEANVRDYQGDVQINKEIRSTLTEPTREEFWWLNNGITVIASEVTVSGDVLSITDPLIVNGLQTSYEIYQTFRALGTGSDDRRTILVRVIVSTDSGTVDRIIKATNSQTHIPKIWLHATEDIHRKIESSLMAVGLYYDRRKNHHRNEGAPAAKIVSMTYLAQALAAIVLQRPDDARARPTTVADRHYNKLFSEDYPPQLYSNSALVLKRIDGFLDSLADLPRGQKSNIMFHLAMYATGAVLESPKPKRPTIAALDVSELTDRRLKDYFERVKTMYTTAGGNDQVAKGTGLVEQLKADLRSRFSRKTARRS